MLRRLLRPLPSPFNARLLNAAGAVTARLALQILKGQYGNAQKTLGLQHLDSSGVQSWEVAEIVQYTSWFLRASLEAIKADDDSAMQAAFAGVEGKCREGVLAWLAVVQARG